jgi:predicted  nucleic acid-binding Zn-ribbon protein
MHPDLEQLVRLQKAESDLRRVEADLGEVPRLKEDLDGRLALDRSRLDGCRSALDESQKARRQHEGDLQALEAKRSKYKGQLMEVKTNKEYTAMLHEIEGVEREIRELEDKILAEMERAESLQAEVKREEAVFKEAQSRHAAEARSLEARARALEEQARRLTAERDAIASQVPEDSLELFRRVARLRGTAVAEARDEMCQLCHMKLRPQMYVDVKRNDAVTQCPSCSRILYFEPPVPVVTPGP